MTEDDMDFSMNISLQEFKTEKNTFWNCFKSNTEFWFYFPLAIVSGHWGLTLERKNKHF